MKSVEIVKKFQSAHWKLFLKGLYEQISDIYNEFGWLKEGEKYYALSVELC